MAGLGKTYDRTLQAPKYGKDRTGRFEESNTSLKVDNPKTGLEAGGFASTESYVLVQDTPAGTPDIVVRKDGGGNHTTIQAGINAASPGNIIEVQNDTQGGTQVWDEEMLITSAGTNGNEITLRFRVGDTFNFYPTTADVYILRILNASYWIIQGDGATVNIGDRSEWFFQNSASSPYTHAKGIYATNSHHFDISGLDFSGANDYQANQMEEDCYLFRFRNCTADKHGSNDDGDGDWGNLFDLQSYDSIAEDSSFSHGGHETFNTSGNGNVVRRCTFDGNWVDVGSTSAGARPCVINNAGQDFTGGQGSPFGPVLFEDNIVKECGQSEFSSGGQRNQTTKLGAWRLIYRYNYLWDNEGQGLSSGPRASSAGEKHTYEVKVYNNTQFNSAAFVGAKDGGDPGLATNLFELLSVKNNLGTSIAGQGNPSAHFIWFDTTEVPISGHPDNWLGAVFNNNQIDAAETHIEVRGSDPETTWFAAAEIAYSSVFSGNSATTPVFVNSGARTKAGFALASGDGINDSESLTSITAGSSDSTTLTVDDAYYFYDGFNLDYFGEEGDWIIIYTDDTRAVEIGIRQIDSITDKNTIVLTTSITVSSGWVIYPMLNQTTTVLNRGAAQ